MQNSSMSIFYFASKTRIELKWFNSYFLASAKSEKNHFSHVVLWPTKLTGLMDNKHAFIVNI